MYKGPKLTDEEFAELARQRDEALAKTLEELRQKYWPNAKTEDLHFHVSPPQNQCYCDCPDGPCQHEFSGWRPFEDGRGGEQFCQRCGLGSMAHDIRFAP
jgi:hypothetical protein